MPKIQLAPNTANSKGDLEESIDLQTVEKLHKNPKPESAQHAIPKLIRRMSTTVMSTVSTMFFLENNFKVRLYIYKTIFISIIIFKMQYNTKVQ